MKLKILIPLIIVIILGAVVASSMFYIVNEGEQVVITEFGRPVGDPAVTAGLKINRILEQDFEVLEEEEGQTKEALEEIQIGREEITRKMREKAQEVVPQFGIELVDVQVKRINYVDEVRQKVFDRMISERQRISEKYKSEGEGEAANIMGQKQKELERIQSEAYKEAEQLKGDADAQAIQIYAEAHGQDPEFFAFLQTLETYRKTSGASTKLILTTDSDLYKYLKDSQLLSR